MQYAPATLRKIFVHGNGTAHGKKFREPFYFLSQSFFCGLRSRWKMAS